ncbi:hypothetical protein [Psychroserpens sp. SPM9]|uniref:hypothetical protein n=1 Tax=Psychroserpens sp. SPM9 TaxID=2975598 RepID=UPI0021A7D0D3|nr:hypothetical protein [Psychroserpens sp. SPM9]MDG5491142.1 hypothetical protein [Psychroserpens sp. SPM9]
MKLFKKMTFAILFVTVIATTFQCASSKVVATQFEQDTPFNIKPVAFQEWYAGIKIGTTGLNVFLPLTNVDQNVTIDSIYFRNLKGKLQEKGEKYIATLQNTTKGYTFKKSERPADYPFMLQDYECVISYIENGVTKYYKITQLNEVAGTYYENGPPSLYLKSASSGMATLDDDED